MLTITVATYHDNPTHRRLADQLMSTYGIDPATVNEIEMTEAEAVVWMWQTHTRVGTYRAYGPHRFSRIYPIPGSR